MPFENYESHLVGLFMQLWGRSEGRISEPATLLTNAQNPFDNWFGDICGAVQHRYFFFEFKRTRDGFLEEVRLGSTKPHRTAFYQHLRADEACRTIARFGHFAAYQENTDLLAFEPYAHSVTPQVSKKAIIGNVFYSSAPVFESDYPAWTFNFREFYDALHESNLSLLYQSSPWLFSNGLGIPEADLEQYVLCMYSHLAYHETETGVLLLGAVDPSTNELKTVALPPFQMVIALHEKFEGLRTAMADELANEAARRKNSFRNDPPN